MIFELAHERSTRFLGALYPTLKLYFDDERGHYYVVSKKLGIEYKLEDVPTLATLNKNIEHYPDKLTALQVLVRLKNACI